MKAYAVHEPERKSWRIYVEQGESTNPTDPGRWYMRPSEPGEPEMVLVAPGQEPPLYMRLPEEIAHAIIAELDERPPATAYHLRDAMTVRDRLLTMLEQDKWPIETITSESRRG